MCRQGHPQCFPRGIHAKPKLRRIGGYARSTESVAAAQTKYRIVATPPRLVAAAIVPSAAVQAVLAAAVTSPAAAAAAAARLLLLRGHLGLVQSLAGLRASAGTLETCQDPVAAAAAAATFCEAPKHMQPGEHQGKEAVVSACYAV